MSLFQSFAFATLLVSSLAYGAETQDPNAVLDQAKKLVNDPAAVESLKDGNVMNDLMKANHGDVNQVQATLQSAMKDPEAFIAKLPPDQQKKIRELAAQIEKRSVEQKTQNKK